MLGHPRPAGGHTRCGHIHQENCISRYCKSPLSSSSFLSHHLLTHFTSSSSPTTTSLTSLAPLSSPQVMYTGKDSITGLAESEFYTAYLFESAELDIGVVERVAIPLATRLFKLYIFVVVNRCVCAFKYRLLAPCCWFHTIPAPQFHISCPSSIPESFQFYTESQN